VSISIGWACYGVDGYSLDELLLAADRAMYADKFRRKSLGPASADSTELDPQFSNVM